ncbi:hypothetical protein ILUMI_10858 [Ignelater luminosus]|uniref:C2H2-type domain-containing protein n=1 Tax=Ignelater luminosus TaxID=2038154 RepID=A0A8K0D671_IGNLU|nr:hypothetical protein ILUMI_10858 [Ignelater luminosus]
MYVVVLTMKTVLVAFESSLIITETFDGTAAKCRKCGKAYKLKSSLTNHVKYDCGKSPQFQCQHCTGERRYIVNEEGRFVCLRCGISYRQKRNLTTHHKYDCGIEPMFSCNICHKKFRRNNILQHHIICWHKYVNGTTEREYVVNEEGRFTCLRCNASYRQKYNLLAHQKYDCGVEPKFTCSICNKKFKRNNTLRYHMLGCH